MFYTASTTVVREKILGERSDRQLELLGIKFNSRAMGDQCLHVAVDALSATWSASHSEKYFPNNRVSGAFNILR